VKLLFVSGVSIGGASKSTRALASVLEERGHAIEVVLGDGRERHPYFQRAVNAWVKLSHTPLDAPLRALLRLPFRHSRLLDGQGAPRATRIATIPENAYLPLLRSFGPDAVVVNSVPRAAWRWIRDDLRKRNIVSILYVREEHATTHLTISDEAPDLLVVNSESHARVLQAAGHDCLLVPSIIDRDEVTVESSRTCALLVNPVAENRVDLMLQLAALRPDIPFVLQESWPLDAAYRRELEADLAALPNVELRPHVSDPGAVYRDARVLLATYPSGRPRVIPEAQHNGIPVLARDRPALEEAVGPGGVLVADDGGVQEWARALGSIWDDADRYEELSALAREHDRRPALDPQRIAETFEQAVVKALSR
jgi:glycosyltransferase involved in cell wall biosynthesis